MKIEFLFGHIGDGSVHSRLSEMRREYLLIKQIHNNIHNSFLTTQYEEFSRT